MSSYERNKGKLVPVNIDTEHFTDEDWEDLIDNGFQVIDGEVYEVVWEVKGNTDCFDFANVKINEDGSINFHTMHYNGGAHWTEMIEWELKRQENANDK